LTGTVRADVIFGDLGADRWLAAQRAAQLRAASELLGVYPHTLLW